MRLGDVILQAGEPALYRVTGFVRGGVRCQSLRPDTGAWDRCERSLPNKMLQLVTAAQIGGDALEARFARNGLQW